MSEGVNLGAARLEEAHSDSENRKVDLSVVMPVYNESQVIDRTISRTLMELQNSVKSHELIVVDDGSTDDSLAQMSKYNEFVRIIHYSPNRGKGYAVRKGIEMASGEHIAIYDSDLNIDPSFLTEFHLYALRTNVDCAVGSKSVKGSEVSIPLLRKVLSTVYHLFAKLSIGLTVRDTQVGLKIFKGTVLRQIAPALRICGYAFDVEILALACSSGHSVVELPIRIENDGRDTNIDLKAIAVMFIETLKIRWLHF